LITLPRLRTRGIRVTQARKRKQRGHVWSLICPLVDQMIRSGCV
jgi:hypothetical protein